MKRINLFALLLVSLIATSCNNKTSNSFSSIKTPSYNNSTSIAMPHSITIKNMENGNVSVNKNSAYAGETINVTVSCDEGYELLEGSLKYNENVIEGNSFIMPDENVEISATFTKTKATYPQTDMIVKSAVNNNEAIAYYEAQYVLAGIQFKMTVIDNDIINEGHDMTKRDSVGLLVNKTSDIKGLVKNETVNFVASSDGYYEISRATSRSSFSDNGAFEMNIAPGNNFFTSSYLTKFDDKSAYVVNVYFGYDLLGTTYEEAYKNLSMCPFLTNANSDGVNNAYGQSGYGYHCYYKNAKTFALISDDNTFVQRATGTSEDILNENTLPDGYILGANFTGPGWWNMTFVCLTEELSLEGVTSVIVQVRINEAINGDWIRLGAATSDGTFYDAFGKNSSSLYSYSVSDYIKPTPDYNWTTGQWGGWDPTWSTSTPPTSYIEVPIDIMFARFNLHSSMTEQVGSSLKDGADNNKKLTQLGVYLTANADYNFSIGNTYVRRNGVIEQITDGKNYSSSKEENKNYCYAVKLDSDIEKPTTLELKVYTQDNEEE